MEIVEQPHSPLANRLPENVDEEFCARSLPELWDKGLSEYFKTLPRNPDGTISRASYIQLSKVDPWRVRATHVFLLCAG